MLALRTVTYCTENEETPERSPALPDIPTIAQAGVDGYDASSWFGLLAPAGTPAEIVNKVSSDVAKVLEDPAVRVRFVALGAQPLAMTPDQFKQFIAAESDKWAKAVKESGARVD